VYRLLAALHCDAEKNRESKREEKIAGKIKRANERERERERERGRERVGFRAAVVSHHVKRPCIHQPGS